jgi:small nuclear ribonucleoprotein (snRNP)-like protein
MNGLLLRVVTFAVLGMAAAASCRADEIQLKDGKTFNGVIVGYDNNMFKVKTDFGFIMVEKSKIAAIIPSGAEGPKNEAKNSARKPSRTETSEPEAEPIKVDAAKSPLTVQPAVESTIEKAPPRISGAPVRPQLPAASQKSAAIAPSLKSTPAAAMMALATPDAPLAPPKDAETPIAPEEVQGNQYINRAYGFRMYKAPSWQLIEDPTALPNAIVAMGTPNESTLMVVGREKTRQKLDEAARTVEGRLHEVYEGYQQTSQRKTTVSGSPAIEYRYRGKADEHDWSGTLVVIARGNDIFTALGMTYADNDLIQIQENVIAKAIASLDFSAR